MQTARKHLVALAVLTLFLPKLVAWESGQDAAIEKAADAYRRAVLAGDVAALGSTYRADAVEMPPCRPPLKGRTSIEQYYRELFGGPIKITDFTFTHLETATAGNIGYTTGTYTQKVLPKSGQPIDDSGNFVVIVKRNGGIWKSAYVIYNSQRPPGMPGTEIPAAMMSPFPGVMNYYAALASALIFRFGLLVLGCASLGLIAWWVLSPAEHS